MIHTATHYLDTSDVHWDVSFTFQDLVMDGIADNLQRSGIKPELAGWVNFDCFEDVLFIYVGFYNKQSLLLTEQYINNLPNSFSDEQINRSLSILQTSSKSKVVVKDPKTLAKQLNTLARRTWDTTITKHSISKKDVLIKKHNAKMFRDITVATLASELTQNEQLLMLRFHAILADMVNFSLSTIPGVYNNNISDIARINNSNNMGCMSTCTIVRGTATLKQLHCKIEDYIKNFDIAANMPAINDHFNTFATNPTWRELPIKYYDNTGIITNNTQIAKQATQANIKSLLGKLTFVVQESTAEDKSLFY